MKALSAQSFSCCSWTRMTRTVKISED